MQIEVGEVATRPFREFGHRPDEGVVAAVLATPEGQRCAPIAVARQRPVDVVLEPLAEPAVLDVRRLPVDGFVLAQQRGAMV